MLRNTDASWGSVARAFHWITGALILGMFAYGLWMTEFPAREDRRFHYAIHASIGISLLSLMVARLIWRFMNPTPKPVQGSAKWEITAAHLGHIGLYVLVLGTLVAGWFLAGSGRRTLDYWLFGIVPMPNMLGTESPYHKVLEETHALFAYAMIGLVVVHIAAAIWHARVKRDGVLKRMATGEPSAPV